MSQILDRPDEHWSEQRLNVDHVWGNALKIVNRIYPFLCVGGSHHKWVYTGNERIIWASGCTDELIPENGPVMVEKVCSICNADDWEYKLQQTSAADKVAIDE